MSGGGDPEWVHRTGPELHPDPSRVLARLFLPGQELMSSGTSRAAAVIDRILALDEQTATAVLADTVSRFADRHHDLLGTFRAHFSLVAHRIAGAAELSATRRDLLGAYFTQEYALEAAALFNPSLVAHPDQAGLADGELRFVMSLRAVGEGHVSSIEFRTGVLGGAGGPRLDAPDPHPSTGTVAPVWLSSDQRAAPPPGDRAEPARDATYWVRYDADRPLSARVVFPTAAVESNGIEDARFVRFTGGDRPTWHATYTAYDGTSVAPRLLTTEDFVTFESRRQEGPSAKDKGMALFPRKVGGRYLALTRWDRESLGLTSSTDAVRWGASTTLTRPGRPWELVQLGQCGSPVETDAGWLVLTHGVGPMRTYGIGAMLLDLEDPTRVLGSLQAPFLTPTAQERDGYVPNVVYSCGGLVHAEQLVLPYGCSDAVVRFALVDLGPLLARLQGRGE